MTNDSTTPPADDPSRRRTSPMAALAVGSLAGLVLGLGGIASAQTPDAPTPSPSTSATPDDGTAETAPAPPSTSPEGDGGADDELCDEPGRRGGPGGAPSDAPTSSESTADEI